MTVQTGLAADAMTGPAAKAKAKLEIRQVWAHNLVSAFEEIRLLAERFPYVSMDTEFPGVIHHPADGKHHALLTPPERYAALKANVDALHLIQVGLAFAASPDAPPAHAYEINLREFDPRAHAHAPASVALLAAHGLDFAAHRERGVLARDFAALLMSSGLVCAGPGSAGVTWVTFHSAYDFGYLVKLLMGRKLPRTLPEFLALVRVFFGDAVYDVRHVMTRCGGLYGGLDRVAASLGVQRAAGRAHQAASDAALTLDAFRRIRHLYFPDQSVSGFAGVLFGLEPEPEHEHVPKEMKHAGAASNCKLEVGLAATASANEKKIRFGTVGAAAPVVVGNGKIRFGTVGNTNNRKLGGSNKGNNYYAKFVVGNKVASSNGRGNRCAAVAGNGGRNGRKVAPHHHPQVAVAALR